jgi:PAS domain S-box-containing protein
MDNSTASLHARLRDFASTSAAVSILIPTAVLVGWGLGITWLTGISSRFVTMKPFTAVCFILSGLSLWLLAPEFSAGSPRRQIGQASAILVALTGLATTLEFASGLNLHFENLLFSAALRATGIPNPGRLSLATGIAFLLLGAALLLIDVETSHGTRPAQFLSFAIVLLSLVHLLGYLFGVEDLYRVFRQNSMAIHTAFLFLFLSLGTISARPDRGLVAIFNGPGIPGQMARRVLPAAVFFTVMIGWLRLLGERYGLYGAPFGLALFSTAVIGLFATLVGWAAHSLTTSLDQLHAASRDLALTSERANLTNARLAAIVQSSEDAIISKTLDGIITSWNPSAQRIFGYSTAEAIGQPMRMLFPPTAVSEETDILARVSRGEPVDHFESIRIRKDGAAILVSGSVSPVREANGTITGASAIVRDITEHRRVELAAMQGQASLTAIIGSAMDAVITIDDQYCVTMFNPAAEAMFRCSASDILGHPLDRLLPTRFRGEHGNHIRLFGQTNTTRRRMGRMGSVFGVRSDGQEFPVEASISQAEVHGQKLFTVILRDITERKLFEEELRQQSALLDLAPVIVRDVDNHIVLWSRGAQQLYGYSKEDAVGQISHDLLQTQFSHPRELIEQALHRDGAWEGELRHCTREGRTVFVASQWVLHYDLQGKPSRILEVNADLTDLKRAQTSQLRSQKMESLGTLAGGVAHDFNNILLAINGNTKLALDSLPPDHPVRRNLSEIAKAGTRATDLVRRILSFSRPQEQKREPQPMQPVVEEALKLVRATLPASIFIETHFQPNLPWVSMDSSQMHQIMVNLATNAAHAIGDKLGTITVRLSTRTVTADDRLGSPDLREGRYVCLSASDDGCGMDRATLDRVFDPFFTTKPVGMGTGLGLSVVHGIVSSYGGTVTAYSQPGQGTSFQLYFPAVDAVDTTDVPGQAHPARRGNQENILYVDDEEGLVALGTVFLERLGYHVTGHIDASVALDDFRSRPAEFAAVITDLSMPRMSGFELARQLRSLRPDLPILMTSGYVRPDDQKAAEALGIRHIILKPSTIDALSQALDDVLPRKASLAAPSA